MTTTRTAMTVEMADQVISDYDALVRRNYSADWDTVAIVAACDEGLHGAFGEVVELAEKEYGWDSLNATPQEEIILDRAFDNYQFRLRMEVARRAL